MKKRKKIDSLSNTNRQNQNKPKTNKQTNTQKETHSPSTPSSHPFICSTAVGRSTCHLVSKLNTAHHQNGNNLCFLSHWQFHIYLYKREIYHKVQKCLHYTVPSRRCVRSVAEKYKIDRKWSTLQRVNKKRCLFNVLE